MSYETLAKELFCIDTGLTQEQLDAALGGIRKTYADLLKAYYIKGISPEELARENGVDRMSIEMTVNAALITLRKHMTKED